jgi:UDP-galactopyranose mutase
VNSLVELVPYDYQPITKVKNKLYNSQFTIRAFNQLWRVTTPQEAKKILDQQIF